MRDHVHIAPLHGLRGLAALAVLFGHFRGQTKFPDPQLATSIGVVLFFVLSGFLMGHIYLRERFTVERGLMYAIARIARIYPLFIFVVCLAAILSLLAKKGVGPFGMTFERVPEHFLMAGSGATIWTISVEFQFYAAFVLVWWAVSRVPDWADQIILSLFAACTIYVIAAGYPDGRIAFLRYAHIFLIGVIASIAWRRYPTVVATASSVALPVSISYFIASYFFIPILYDQNDVYEDLLLCLVCGVLVLTSVANPTSTTGKILSSKIAHQLGEMSFGIYLLHRIVMFLWQQAGYLGLKGIPLTILLFSSTMLAAWLANNKIENPCRAAIRDWYADLRQRRSQRVQ
ncbi:acyltransferase family protein [Mycoplana dimorpha]|uniref:Peptidoglycan/LPS O-acetylase OafA/YrhL n=1 Tax=Mycoplana dimorpha TaxID=28320 RepID=A0A2T5BE13_MYCDI|nr:acyltransferase [Mycoplana dimorpha]PTM97234.1 peptidoglycan/LPS O-acetylase OafA/YrhL [Mycoplana dimorpha]